MRLLLLLSGIAFFGVGVWMIKSGISAEGSIDIRSELLSGSLKTGSVGLFITFFSFFMILFSVIFSKSPAVSQPKPEESSALKSKWRVIRIILFSLYALTIIADLIARSTTGNEQFLFGCLTGLFGFVSVFLSVGMVLRRL
jgi:hypothetical protein